MLRRHREPCLSIDLRARSVVVGSDRPDSRATSQARKGRWGSRSFGRGAFVHSSFCALCARLSRVRAWSRFGFNVCRVLRLFDRSSLSIIISVKSILDRSKYRYCVGRRMCIVPPVRKQFEREECSERYWGLRLQHGSSISIKKL